MSAYLQSVWQLRYFWMSLVRHDLMTRYRRSVLGIGWSLLHPIGMTCVLCVVFHKLFALEIREYAPFLLAGLAFWSFISNTVLTGCQAFYHAEPYLRQYPAPMAIYPLRVAAGTAFHFLMASSVVLLLAWAAHGFGNLPVLAGLVPAFALLVIFGWSLATLAALANAYFPDMQHVLELALQVLFYLTPIIYPPAILRSKGMGWLVDFNPLSAVLDLVRVPVLDGTLPSLSSYGLATSLVAVTFGCAVLALRRMQSHLIFHI